MSPLIDVQIKQFIQLYGNIYSYLVRKIQKSVCESAFSRLKKEFWSSFLNQYNFICHQSVRFINVFSYYWSVAYKIYIFAMQCAVLKCEIKKINGKADILCMFGNGKKNVEICRKCNPSSYIVLVLL